MEKEHLVHELVELLGMSPPLAELARVNAWNLSEDRLRQKIKEAKQRNTETLAWLNNFFKE